MRKKDRVAIAIRYIEEHSMEPMTVEQLAVLSGCSADWLAHAFYEVTQLSVGDYIRRQRLALAARDLLEGLTSTTVALKYGFETASGFAKSFRKYYNCSPSEYKTSWEKHLEPSFRELPELTVLAHMLVPPSKDFPLSEGGAYWMGKDFSSVTENEWAKISCSGLGEIGAWIPADSENGGKIYAFGPVVTKNSFVPAQMRILTVPAARYAAFKVPASTLNSEMHNHIVALWNKLYELWFANGKFHYDDGKIAFELYSGFDTFIYVPIKE